MFGKKGFTAAAIVSIAMIITSVAEAAYKPGFVVPMPITPLEIKWFLDIVLSILMGI